MNTDLVEKIRLIDPKAAEYIENDAKSLISFSRNATDLWGIFEWRDTPQGHTYWEEIARKL